MDKPNLEETHKINPSRWGALLEPGFRIYLFGLSFTYIGFWAQVVAQSWLVLRLTDSPFLLGLVMSTNTLPFLVFALPGGVFADQFSKRIIIIFSRGFTTLLVIILVVLASSNFLQVWHIFVIALLISSLDAIDLPARQSLIPELVPKHAIVSGISFSTGLFHGGRIIGPAIAGVIISKIGESGAFTIFAISNLILIACLTIIKSTNQPIRKPKRWAIHKDILDALNYIRSNKNALSVSLLAVSAYFFIMTPMSLLPDFIRSVLFMDSVGLGNLATGQGLGALLAGLLIAISRDLKRKGRLVLSSCFVLGISLLLFSQTTNFIFAYMSLVIFGFALGAFSTLTMTLLFELVPNSFHGRVMSLVVLCWGFTAFGNILTGFIAELYSTPISIAMAGTYMCICGILVYIFLPALRKI